MSSGVVQGGSVGLNSCVEWFNVSDRTSLNTGNKDNRIISHEFKEIWVGFNGLNHP